MPASVNQRVKKHRDALRAAGLRPVQIWVPDTRAPGFEEEYRRQAALVGAADRANPEDIEYLEAALDEFLSENPE